MSGVYQDYALSLAPRWLQGARAAEQIQATAAPLDDLALKTRSLMLARLVPYAPEDVLMTIGAERGIRRFPGEPLGTYRNRVSAAWSWWRMAGTLPGMKRLLELSGYQASIQEHFKDPDREHWAEFSITVTPTIKPEPDASWGENDLYGGDGAHWGYRLYAVPPSSLVDLVNEIKPGHARLRRLLFTLGDTTWGGGERWGNEASPAKLHPWGSPWGQPSVTFGKAGGSEGHWGEGRFHVLYDMNDPLTHNTKEG